MFIGKFEKNITNFQLLLNDERLSNKYEKKTSNYFFQFFSDKDTYTFESSDRFVVVDGYINYNDNPVYNSAAKIIDNLYSNYGMGFTAHISGKYAIILFDFKTETLYLVLDRFGEKKISYCHKNNSFYFGNSTKIVGKNAGETSINSHALGMFFTYNYICAPLTIFENVSKVKPGYYLKINENITYKEYWDITSDQPLKNNINDSKKEILDLLQKTINDNLESSSCKSPVLFLSGGIDSSVLCKVLSENKIKATTMTTRFIGGKDTEDESSSAKIIANHYGLKHEIIEIDPNVLKNRIKIDLSNADEPMANRTYSITSIMMEKASTNCDCVITGDGGDELFWGYPQYQRIIQAEKIYKMLALINQIIPEDFLKKILPAKAFSVLYNGKRTPGGQLFTYNKSVISQKTILNCYSNLFYPDAECLEGKDWSTKKNYYDLVYGTQAAIRKWNDNASQYGIQHMSPFLCKEMVFLSRKIPKRELFDKKNNKIILRKIVSDDIPNIGLLPKHGFDVPTSKWLQTTYKSDLEHFTSKEFIEKQGIFSYDMIAQIKEKFDRDIINYQNNADAFMWNYFSFQCWYQGIEEQ